MTMEELQALWTRQSELLARSVAIDERLLREQLLRRPRAGLAWFRGWRGCEVVVSAAVAALAVVRWCSHPGEPRYLLVAGSVALFAAVIAVQGVIVLARSAELDWSAPVVTLQRALARMKLAEYRAFQWALLGGVVLWLPLPLLLLDLLAGGRLVPQVELGWIAANVAVGVVLMLLGRWLSRRLVERSDRSPLAHRLIDAVASRYVRRTAKQLDELAAFVREDGPRTRP